MLASRIFRYCSVSGASCLSAGLLGSYRGVPTSVRLHWPDQSGNFDSSCARAAGAAISSAVANANAAVGFRLSMAVLPVVGTNTGRLAMEATPAARILGRGRARRSAAAAAALVALR